MSKKVLLLSLIKAQSEEEVSKIIGKDPILSKEGNWKPYGGFRGNFSQIHNQQCDTIPALVEKPMNSIDALLIKQCKLAGINPQSHKAPQSVQDAVEKLFNIKGGNFSELTGSERRAIAENIQIIAEGSRQKPNIIVYDYGEGQHPDDFENTIVSLNKDNKIKIKFVQGVYNMGGSGVLPNCGYYKYQLILSRKTPELLNGKADEYGFTLVRLKRIMSTDEYKNSWYEYCVDDNGKILRFSAEETLDLDLYKRKFSSGTYIKLYNYDLPDPSNITLGLWRDLNRYLYAPALPVLLYEKRQYKGHTPSKIMLGNRMRIMIDERTSKETTFPMEINFNEIKFPAEVTVFKETVSKKDFVDKLAVIFSYNGQVHDYLSNAFITSKAKLAYLSGSVLMNIDCTQIPTGIRSELFMASRDRMRDNTVSRTLKEEIAKELKDHDILRQLNEKRRDEKIFKNPKDEQFLEKVMGKLLRKNSEISKLLGLNGSVVSNLQKTIKKKLKKQGEVFKPKRFPTYMKFKRIAPGNIKMLPQAGQCKIEIETDVEDEYLIRPKDKGSLIIFFEKPHLRKGGKGSSGEGSDEEAFDVNVVGPSQGQIKLRVKTKKELPVGTIIPMNIKLSNPQGAFTLTAFIKIAKDKDKSKEKKKEKPITYALPKIIQVYKEAKQDIKCAIWSDPGYNWNSEDICKIFPSLSEESLVDAVAINMDANVLHNYIRSRKLTDKNIEHVKRLFQVGIFLISLILYFQISRRDDIEEKEELLSYLMKGVGSIIIQVIINEEIIKEIEREE